LSFFDNDQTIAAIATPLGIGGIAIIRMSGNEVTNIIKKIFINNKDVKNLIPWTVNLGKIVENSKILDEVFVTFFKKPKSYTKEDMIEISCHGGNFIARKILELILKNGARLAIPGEFTKRAFLNGRIDLSQAEAVAELINAKTEKSLQISLQHIEGFLNKKISLLRESLINSISLLELEVDFAEEDLEFLERNELIGRLANLLEDLELLISSYKKGKIISEGVKLVIVGKQNVGKSTIYNALLKEERAIVTNIPGTTRDILENELDIKGIFFRLVDTAGFGITEDIVEQEGINRTKKEINAADIILHVLDGSEEFTREDEEIKNILEEVSKLKKVKLIAVINKMDLKKKIRLDNFYQEDDLPIIEISAMQVKGIDQLENAIYCSIMANNQDIITLEDSNRIIITKVRHLRSLERARISITNAINAIIQKMPSEIITIDLKEALDNLGEIIGVTISEEILNNIFNKFCIGK